MSMGLETLFYTLGIITMGIFLLMCIAIIAIVLKVKHEVQQFKESFAGKVVNVLKERNMEVASALGLSVAHFVIDKIRQNVEEKRKS